MVLTEYIKSFTTSQAEVALGRPAGARQTSMSIEQLLVAQKLLSHGMS